MLPTAGIFALLAPRKDEILMGALARSQMSGAAPTIDNIKDAALHTAKQMASDMLTPLCAETLNSAVVMFQLTRGVRPEGDYNAPAILEWRDLFDTHLMDAVGIDALRLAGQDFIGEYLTDSELDETAVRDTAARKMADNMAQSSIGERQAGQVLAEIGIVAEDLLKLAPGATAGAPAAAQAAVAVIAEPIARAHVERLVGAWAISVGIGGVSSPGITDLLATAFEDDAFIPLSAIKSMGGKDADAPYFAAYFKAAGKDAITNTANAAMMAALTGSVVELPKDAPKPRKPKKGEQTGLTTAPAPPPPPPVVTADSAGKPAGKEDISDVIRLVREHTSMTDEDLGKFIGKSRATVKNIVTGKSPAKVTPEQRATFKADILTRVAGLQSAADRL